MAAVAGELIEIEQLLYVVSEQAIVAIAQDDWMIDTALDNPYVLEQWDGVSQLNPTHKKVIATSNDEIAFEEIHAIISATETRVTFDPIEGLDKLPQSFVFDAFGGENDDPDCPDCGDRVPTCTINEVEVETIDCNVVVTIVSYHT